MARRENFKNHLARGRELELVEVKTGISLSSQRRKAGYLNKLKLKHNNIKKDYKKLRKEMLEEGVIGIPKWHELEYKHNSTVNSLEELRSLGIRKGNEREAITAINILRWLLRTEAKGARLKGLVKAAEEQKSRWAGIETMKNLRETGKLRDFLKDVGIQEHEMRDFEEIVNKLIKTDEKVSYENKKNKFLKRENLYRYKLNDAIEKMAREEGWDLEKKHLNKKVLESRKSAFNELNKIMDGMSEKQKNHIIDFMISTGITEKGDPFVRSM